MTNEQSTAPQDEIRVEKPPKAVKADSISAADPKVEKRTATELHKEKLHRIIIRKTETQKDDVFLGVNGHTYQIQRDKPVDLPTSALEVLDNAVITSYSQERRADGEGYEMVPHTIRRFPYERV